MQSRHVEASEQVSTIGHDDATQLHVAHIPVAGPVEVPVLQVPVAAHQPHEEAAVQDAQSVFIAHVSGGAVHSELSHDQSPVQLPVVGPVVLPERHAPSQNPQPGRAVHVSQVVASAQGSVGPVHSLARHAHVAHEPLEGPVEVPTPQAPVAPHQPQG